MQLKVMWTEFMLSFDIEEWIHLCTELMTKFSSHLNITNKIFSCKQLLGLELSSGSKDHPNPVKEPTHNQCFLVWETLSSAQFRDFLAPDTPDQTDQLIKSPL